MSESDAEQQKAAREEQSRSTDDTNFEKEQDAQDAERAELADDLQEDDLQE
jgi:hypothetical protein